MESKEGLHPSVYKFKQFMKDHPLLMIEIQQNRKTLQNLFEEWTILGADDEQWQTFMEPDTSQGKDKKTSQNVTATLGQITSLISRMNVQDLQNHLAQFSSVLSNVQSVIQTFQRPNNEPPRSPQDHPFSFRRD